MTLSRGYFVLFFAGAFASPGAELLFEISLISVVFSLRLLLFLVAARDVFAVKWHEDDDCRGRRYKYLIEGHDTVCEYGSHKPNP